ncbi:MAG: McrC family protein [Methylophaga sp.]|nr:McrC family protein [Methylophaga sp.]
MSPVTIREYGVLYRAETDSLNVADNLDSREITKTAWDWLLATTGTDEHKFLVKPIRRNNQIGLQVVNYVGVITTPCGYQIEILPKIVSHLNENDKKYLKTVRKKLFTMLNAVQRLKFKSFHNASLEIFDQPLPDVLIRIFLEEVKMLIKKGIRNDYVSIREQTPFLKGRLKVAAQIRQPVGRQHLFQVEYDEFLPDRAENRLIHSSLKKVAKWSHSVGNKRLANELLFVFDDIPVSMNTKLDFNRWLDRDRSMVHYRGLKEWCELIINEESPFSLVGHQHGLSFLFPMNDLFEEYVARCLEKRLAHGFGLTEQKPQKYLAYRETNQGQKGLFTMKPDIVIHEGTVENSISILDTKWKRIEQEKSYENGSEDYKRGVSQADMYQLYAYGQKYLSGKGNIFLIYPETDKFKLPLPAFDFGEGLKLWAVPFVWNDAGDYIEFGESEVCGWIDLTKSNKISV